MPVSAPVIRTTGESMAMRSFFGGSCTSGIHSAIDGKIRPGNVGGLRTGNERDHRSDLFNTPIAVERCGGFLGHCPITGRRIQVRVDRTRLDVVDRDPAAPELSGKRLSEHLDGSFRGRVGHKPWRDGTLAYCRTDHDDAAAALHVLQRRLRGGEDTSKVYVNHAVHLLLRRLLERFWNGRAGTVHKHVKPSEGRNRPFNRAPNSTIAVTREGKMSGSAATGADPCSSSMISRPLYRCTSAS